MQEGGANVHNYKKSIENLNEKFDGKVLARSIVNWCGTNCVKSFVWPSHSPDLNRLDIRLNHGIKRRVWASTNPKQNLDQLDDSIKQSVLDIPR